MHLGLGFRSLQCDASHRRPYLCGDYSWLRKTPHLKKRKFTFKKAEGNNLPNRKRKKRDSPSTSLATKKKR